MDKKANKLSSAWSDKNKKPKKIDDLPKAKVSLSEELGKLKSKAAQEKPKYGEE